MPIQSYGLKWRYDLGMTGFQAGADPVDFSGQIGVYILYRDDDIVYVGESSKGKKKGIYGKLIGHKDDGWAFSTYSWFGVLPLDAQNHIDLTAANLSAERLVKNLEAMLIYLLEPSWNTKPGEYKHIPRYEQCPSAEARSLLAASSG